MNLSLFIARKYFFSKKINKSINIISFISLISVMFATMALIIILSIYNGFEDIIKSCYNSFNPDLVIKPKKGKYFTLDEVHYNLLKNDNRIKSYSKVIEESVLIKYQNKQHIVIVKGIEEDYVKMSGLKNLITSGECKLYLHKKPSGIIGLGVANKLGIRIEFLNPVFIYYPNKNLSTNITEAENLFSEDYFFPSSIFSVNNDIDNSFVILPIKFVSRVLQVDSSCISYFEIALSDINNLKSFKNDYKKIFGNSFEILDRNEQQKDLYKVINTEKFSIILILAFIILIASYSIISSSSMLVITKKKDIKILKILGFDNNKIKRIFVINSLLIIVIGALLGLIIGILIVAAQYNFHLLKVDGLLLDYYPVILNIFDILWVFGIILFIGFFLSCILLLLIKNNNDKE